MTMGLTPQSVYDCAAPGDCCSVSPHLAPLRVTEWVQELRYGTSTEVLSLLSTLVQCSLLFNSLTEKRGEKTLFPFCKAA